MMSFFKGRQCEIKSNEIIKEGWLSKESKYMKVWRERWSVLNGTSLVTFEKERVYQSPTEIIDVTSVKTIKSDEKDSTVFKVETNDGTFLFKAKTYEDKEAWIGAIGKTMIKSSNPNLFIQEED